ncbi:MAG: ATP-binding protein [Deltaproteobacteria bacterium]|nr:ATP-binding protein [Deltaproteobacteria bacterium]
MQLSELLELNGLARQDARSYPRRRWLAEKLEGEKGKHFIGIVGPRGAGKTILLRQDLLRRDDAIYLSLDTFEEDDLFDWVKRLHQDHGYTRFLLDEVHFIPHFEAALKKIYDFLDVEVLFTSSVALAMQRTARRVRLLELRHFGLREYVHFQHDRLLPRLSLVDIRDRRWTRQHLECAPLFERFVQGRCLTFALEEPDPLPGLKSILDKILVHDVPRVARLTHEEIDRISKMLRFIGRSSVDGIHYSSISRNIGITKYKAEAYVKLLQQAFVLHAVYPKGANVMRQAKVLMAVPFRLLYRDWDQAVGGLREDFFADAMRSAGLDFHYLKTTRGSKTPDYLLRAEDGSELVAEIGGQGKGRSQFKGYRAEQKLIFSSRQAADGMHRPLFLLGFTS